MSFNLLENIRHRFSDEVNSSLAALMEVDEESIVHDLPVVSAAVVAGLIKKSSSQSGIGTLSGLLEAERPDLADETADESRSTEVVLSDKSAVAQGTNTLDRVFGSGLDDLIGAVARYCKLPKYKLRDLFGAAGKSCMAELSRLQRLHDFDTEDVASLILMQGPEVSTTLPDNLYSALGLRRKSAFATKLKEERFEAVDHALNKPAKANVEANLLKKLAPVAIIVLLILVAWVIFKSMG